MPGTCWWWRPSGLRSPSVWGSRSKPRWFTGCWRATTGAKSAPDTRHPKSNPATQQEWKKLPEALAALLIPDQVKGRRVRLMFQDEARFGRMVRIRRCWAPAPARPVVDNGYEREFTYVYGAVSPLEGEHDSMRCAKMDAEHMGAFLAQVSAAHPDEFMLMNVDGASSHVAKALEVPENIKAPFGKAWSTA